MKINTFFLKHITWILSGFITLIMAIPMFDVLFCDRFDGVHTYFEESINHTYCILYFIFESIIDTFFLSYFLVILPIKIIFLVCKGIPFDIRNVKNLHVIAYFLLSIDFIVFIQNCILNLILFNKLSILILIKVPLNKGWQWYLIAGVIVFAIARVFKRSHNLRAIYH